MSDHHSSGDKLASGFIAIGAALLIAVAAAKPALFGSASKDHPFLMGFAKLFLLGTFGELLKCRFARGNWSLDKVLQRAAVWGLFGLWFTLAFPGFSALVDALVAARLWPSRIGVLPDSIWMAFSKSLWINFLGMFAWGMMVTHEYFNYLIRSGWRSWGLKGFAGQVDPGFAFSFIPKTLLFWIPAHTFTFAMPPEWRVFIAALLAIVLGFLLGVGRKATRTE